MVILVVVGTILDMMHKKSAQYFFENAKRAQKDAKRTLSGGEKASLAVQTVVNEVLTSSEFKRTRRRISHLFTMYGFIIFVASTAVLIFGYATEAAAGIWPVLWHLGALMLCFGGYWFWFFIRVDVAAEGVKWYNFNGRGDIFIISSMSGKKGDPRATAYAASKFGVEALTEALRMEVAGSGVRVSCIEPGLVETEFSVVRFHGDEERAESVYEGFEPLTADDVADVVAFVATRPAHVNVHDVVLLPTAQRNAYVLDRKAE